MNKKETDLLNYANLLLNQKNQDIQDDKENQEIHYFEDEEPIETIFSKINRISYLTNFQNFRWQSGINHSISDDRKTITATTTKYYECCVKATEKMPKKGIHKWKVKINSYPSTLWANIQIGICPTKLSYFAKNPFENGWTMDAYYAKYFAKNKKKDFSFNKKELVAGDIIGVKFNSSNGE